jgi:hypothetical protein
MLHAEERAEHIGIEGGGVAVGGLLRHRAGPAFGAGGVDGRVEATEACDGLIDQAAHIVFVAHVRTDEFGLCAEGAQLARQRLAGFVLAAGDDHAVALLRESKGCSTADAG